MHDHHVTVKLTRTENGTPHRWKAECKCGWWVSSWQWIATDRDGGALPIALSHVEYHRSFELRRERLAERMMDRLADQDFETPWRMASDWYKDCLRNVATSLLDDLRTGEAAWIHES